MPFKMTAQIRSNDPYWIEVASNSFLESSVVVSKEDKTVNLSKLLLWYRDDFGSTDAQVLAKLADIMTNPDFRKNLKRASENGFKIDYVGYDWSLNSKSWMLWWVTKSVNLAKYP